MSLYSAFDYNKHFSETDDPLQTQEGNLSSAVRKARCRTNLGLAESAFIDDSVEVAADELVIPVTAGVVLKTTGGDAEALTLADGTPGQILTIQLTVDGGGAGTLHAGDGLVFGTIVFADALDGATLMYVDDTVGWTILGMFGNETMPDYTLPA